jgi:hypothetical protein
VWSTEWEEYRGNRYSDGDNTLVVELWLDRVTDDLSGLTFQEWDPSAGSTCGEVVRKFHGVGNSTFVLSVETTMTSGQDVCD